MNNFPKGNDLIVKWAIKYSDGTPFPLENYAWELCYSAGRGINVVNDTAVISVSDNLLTWRFSGKDQVFYGKYSLTLRLYQQGKIVATVSKNNAFELSTTQYDGSCDIDLVSYCDNISLQDALLRGNKAMEVAQDAKVIAESAVNTAGAAVTTANEAESIANTANATSTEAKTIAGNAKTVADQAKTTADAAAATATQKAEEVAQKEAQLEAALNNLSPDQSGALALSTKVNEHGEKLSELNEKVDALALGAFYGYFPDSSSLPVDVTTPGYAYVGSDNPYEIWNFNGESWSDSGTSIDMNDADEEDITRNADGKLQFKGRPYGDGMGYVILRKGKTFAEQVTQANTIYEIRYDFDLNGEQINIPSYSILFFNGGSLSNGTISGNQSKIISKDLTIFKNGIVCLGEWENESVYSEWFDESYTNFRLICTNLIALCKEYGNVIIERDTFFKADDLQISLSKGINFDFKNTTLRLEEQTITELNPVTPKYIFISNRQDKILRNLKFANLNIKAVANLQESGQFSGKTSGWGFIYISNIDNCTFENITFEHVATGFKVGYINGNDLGRKNIKFYRCSLTGKMLIQLFDVDNISIEDCVFDLSDTDNDLDHCLYLVTNNNVNIKKCTFKNAPSAINIWNASDAALKDDIVNVSITQSKVINSGFLNLIYASNANIDSVYIENALDISEYKGYTLFNIWRSHNITISNVYCSQDKLALKNVFNKADNVTYRNTYINAYMLSFEVQDSALNILNSQFSIKAYLDSHRLINGYGASRIRVCNCIFNINNTNASESIFIDNNTHFLLDNCNMLATGGSKQTLLLRLPTSKNAFIKNSYIEFRLTLLTIDQNPVVLNCKNANGEILDFPYIKFTDKSTINKLAQYLSQYDAGFTTFDSTNKEPVLWDGAAWIKINGDSIDANSIGTSAQRPTGVRDGFLYYDTTLKKYIVWNGTEWTNMDGTALG